MSNINLYNILDISDNSSLDDIKRAYKKKALLYHPDKHMNLSKEEIEKNTTKFRQIRVAYEILSDKIRREKYDKMNQKQKNSLFDNIMNYIIELMSNDIKNVFKNQINSNIENIQDKIINYLISNKKIIFSNETEDKDIKLQDIFFPYSDNIKLNDNLESFEKNIIDTNNRNTSDININELNIIGNIETTLEEIYNNKFKEITIKKKVINNNNDIIDSHNITIDNKFQVPLYNPQIIIKNGGDYNIDNNIYGDVILNVLQKKHRKFKRINYDIIYNDNITLFNLFTGFIKEIKYFNNEIIELSSSEPLEEFKFDGNKLKIVINNKGLPYTPDGIRGDLIIYLYLLKDQNFYKNLKLYYSK